MSRPLLVNIGISIHFLEKNRQKISRFIKKHKDLLNTEFSKSFSGEVIEKLAKESGFVKRTSSLNGIRFLELLMFNSQQGNLSSLNNLAEDFEAEHGVSISKQGLDERFNQQAVEFLKMVLSHMLSAQIQNKLSNPDKALFTTCRLRDSSRFGLPDEYASVYRGYGGATKSASIISIQHEFDLLSGNQIDLQLTSGCRNDQQDSKESVDNVNKGDLLIRDLGYVTTTYLKSVINKEAYFLNRMPSQVHVYDVKNQHEKIDFEKLYKKMEKYNLPYVELDVTMGEKAKIPCRLIVFLNKESTYKSRLKRTTKNTKSIGCKVSKEQKTKSRLDIYITNTEEEMIEAKNIKSIYSLRWQIELVFKVWKSLCKIDKIKKVKIHRFECMLLAGLIWILANWKVFQYINKWFTENIKDKTPSIWKFFELATNRNSKLRRIIFRNENITPWLELLLAMSEKKLYRETKKGDVTHLQKLELLFCF